MNKPDELVDEWLEKAQNDELNANSILTHKDGTPDSEITQFNKDLKILNRYYIETRYPGDYPEFSWNDAEEALAAAEKIKNFVLKKEKLDKS